ncbi:PGS1 isoform 14, partial [Pan troglodytes]
LTTGYFNLTQAYMDLVLGTRAEYQILLASPEVNGFFGAKGVAGAIPAAYVHIERQFYSEVCSLGQQERVQLQEYWRRGWTFHAKGARAALPEVRCGVLCHLRAAESPGEAVGEDGDSTDQELLLRTDRCCL